MNQYLTRDVIRVAHQFDLYRDAFSMELMSMERFQGEEFWLPRKMALVQP